jgi:hypothetical protein
MQVFIANCAFTELAISLPGILGTDRFKGE